MESMFTNTNNRHPYQWSFTKNKASLSLLSSQLIQCISAIGMGTPIYAYEGQLHLFQHHLKWRV
ncbi:hypothetical protein D9M68_682200 [compost metagenome]